MSEYDCASCSNGISEYLCQSCMEFKQEFGIDPIQMHGDYAEAFQYLQKTWKVAEIDEKFYPEK